MTQVIKNLRVADLVLWTENPRDPIDARATDQDVVDQATSDRGSKWNLLKLAKEMGRYYDFSELPTVVMHGRRPVVYDGNRRMVLAKIKHGLVKAEGFDGADLPDIPVEIPCNVCSKDIALKNVYRKHADSGSWLPLERDMFIHRYMNEGKSQFLLLEESTGIISAYPGLNQRFVKEEIFRDDVLQKLGFSFENGTLLSRHSSEEALSILNDIASKVRDGVITTRKRRGDVLGVLDERNRLLVEGHKAASLKRTDIEVKASPADEAGVIEKRSRRTKPKGGEIFGGPLYLRSGVVSNVYRDIDDLYGFYVENKRELSDSFPGIIRMALRLLCETACKDCNQRLDAYIKSRFPAAKDKLSKDEKTTLSSLNVTEATFAQLLHTGAHNYTASSNLEQTMAMALIIGGMISASHGQRAAR